MADEESDQFGRKLYDAVCSDCGNPCKVPFQPSEGRPVYCKDCYRKHKPSFGGGRGGGRRFGGRGRDEE